MYRYSIHHAWYDVRCGCTSKTISARMKFDSTYDAAIDAVRAIISAPPASFPVSRVRSLIRGGSDSRRDLWPRICTCAPLWRRERHPHANSAPRAARLTPVSFEGPYCDPPADLSPTTTSRPCPATVRSRRDREEKRGWSSSRRSPDGIPIPPPPPSPASLFPSLFSYLYLVPW